MAGKSQQPSHESLHEAPIILTESMEEKIERGKWWGGEKTLA